MSWDGIGGCIKSKKKREEMFTSLKPESEGEAEREMTDSASEELRL